MKDGRLKNLHIIGHKEEDLETGPRFIGAIQDVTDYRRSEEAARRSEAFLAEGERLSQTGSFSWRVAQNEIVWSEQVYRMFGYESSTAITLELIGARMHPEDLHLLEDMVKRASQGVADFAYEYRLLLPGGSIRHLQLIAHGHRDREGLMEYIGAVQDVTERRIAEETLSRARSELAHIARVSSLGALTASIAHEVNQPLAGIIANASTCLKMLAADPPNVAGAEETARRTLRDGNRAADVIRRLRALVTKRDAVREPVDLSEAAREVVALSSGDLQRNRITLKVALADPLPPVTGDRVQLQQVILNLMLNAADAMDGVDDRPRQILITTERDGDRVRLAVRDSGTGLAPDVADRLFEAFYTTKTNGMGIGLSISRSIVENHGGRLWAEPNTGPGATFCFSVPCGVDCAAGAADLRADGQSAAAVPQPTTVKD
jgi:PAS domain S-box-containing protein